MVTQFSRLLFIDSGVVHAVSQETYVERGLVLPRRTLGARSDEVGASW